MKDKAQAHWHPTRAPFLLTYAQADDCQGGEDLQTHQQRAVQDLQKGQEVEGLSHVAGSGEGSTTRTPTMPSGRCTTVQVTPDSTRRSHIRQPVHHAHAPTAAQPACPARRAALAPAPPLSANRIYYATLSMQPCAVAVHFTRESIPRSTSPQLSQTTPFTLQPLPRPPSQSYHPVPYIHATRYTLHTQHTYTLPPSRHLSARPTPRSTPVSSSEPISIYTYQWQTLPVHPLPATTHQRVPPSAAQHAHYHHPNPHNANSHPPSPPRLPRPPPPTSASTPAQRTTSASLMASAAATHDTQRCSPRSRSGGGRRNRSGSSWGAGGREEADKERGGGQSTSGGQRRGTRTGRIAAGGEARQ